MYLLAILVIPFYIPRIFVPETMVEVRKILAKILLLVIDILVFGWKCIKQIILPGSGRKGNLLTTLFNLFDGLIDRLNDFQENTFKIASLTLKKRVKQTVLLLGTVLFLLSLLEWTPDQKNTYFSQVKCAEQYQRNNAGNSARQSEPEIFRVKNQTVKCKPSFESAVSFPSFSFIPSIKRYLFVRSLLI